MNHQLSAQGLILATSLNGWTPVQLRLPDEAPIYGDRDKQGSWPSVLVQVCLANGIQTTATYDHKWKEWKLAYPLGDGHLSGPCAVLFWRNLFNAPGQPVDLQGHQPDSFALITALKDAASLMHSCQLGIMALQRGKDQADVFGREAVLRDQEVARLTRELDQAIFLDEAAENASLIDLVPLAQKFRKFHDGIAKEWREQAQRIDFLVQETHNWSTAVRKMTEERTLGVGGWGWCICDGRLEFEMGAEESLAMLRFPNGSRQFGTWRPDDEADGEIVGVWMWQDVDRHWNRFEVQPTHFMLELQGLEEGGEQS